MMKAYNTTTKFVDFREYAQCFQNFLTILKISFSNIFLRNYLFNHPETSWEKCRILLRKYIRNF